MNIYISNEYQNEINNMNNVSRTLVVERYLFLIWLLIWPDRSKAYLKMKIPVDIKQLTNTCFGIKVYKIMIQKLNIYYYYTYPRYYLVGYI